MAINDVTGGNFDITLETFSEFLCNAEGKAVNAMAHLLNEDSDTETLARAARELRAMYLQDAYTKRVIDGLAESYAQTL
jgi:hypothetical protein